MWENSRVYTNALFSLVVVVDLTYLLQNFKVTEDNILHLVFKVTYLISGIVFGLILVAIWYSIYIYLYIYRYQYIYNILV